MSKVNQSLIKVKEKIALAIRNNYLNSNLPFVELASRYKIDLPTLCKIIVDDGIEWQNVSIEVYLEIAFKLNINITLNVTIER